MNEISGPNYYVLASDHQYAEVNSFHRSQALLLFKIHNFFLKNLDDSDSGIKQLPKQKYLEVQARPEQQNLYPLYYSFRWLTVIMPEEFPFPDVVLIWILVFADENRIDFFVRICCAMTVSVIFGKIQFKFWLSRNFGYR